MSGRTLLQYVLLLSVFLLLTLDVPGVQGQRGWGSRQRNNNNDNNPLSSRFDFDRSLLDSGRLNNNPNLDDTEEGSGDEEIEDDAEDESSNRDQFFPRNNFDSLSPLKPSSTTNGQQGRFDEEGSGGDELDDLELEKEDDLDQGSGDLLLTDDEDLLDNRFTKFTTSTTSTTTTTFTATTTTITTTTTTSSTSWTEVDQELDGSGDDSDDEDYGEKEEVKEAYIPSTLETTTTTSTTTTASSSTMSTTTSSSSTASKEDEEEEEDIAFEPRTTTERTRPNRTRTNNNNNTKGEFGPGKEPTFLLANHILLIILYSTLIALLLVAILLGFCMVHRCRSYDMMEEVTSETSSDLSVQKKKVQSEFKRESAERESGFFSVRGSQRQKQQKFVPPTNPNWL